MSFKTSLPIIAFFIFLLSTSCSENSSNEKEKSEEPVVSEHYYFEGKLDGEPFLIEKKYYEDFYFDEEPFSIDYGGTLINCNNEPEDQVHSDCYTIYASGILIYNGLHPEEVGKHNTAKMYFGSIDVENKTFTDELESLNNFFNKEELKFRRDFGDPKIEAEFAFDFFPIDSDNNQVYYSSRFNDNSEYKAVISSVEELEDYFYAIEGSIETCKLYDSNTYSDETPTYKLLTDLKFRVKIKGDFNYNNYKDN